MDWRKLKGGDRVFVFPNRYPCIALVGWYLMARTILLIVTLIPAKWMARQAGGAP